MKQYSTAGMLVADLQATAEAAQIENRGEDPRIGVTMARQSRRQAHRGLDD